MKKPGRPQAHWHSGCECGARDKSPPPGASGEAQGRSMGGDSNDLRAPFRHVRRGWMAMQLRDGSNLAGRRVVRGTRCRHGSAFGSGFQGQA